jgi:hypothetical protein
MAKGAPSASVGQCLTERTRDRAAFTLVFDNNSLDDLEARTIQGFRTNEQAAPHWFHVLNTLYQDSTMFWNLQMYCEKTRLWGLVLVLF